MPNPRTRFLVFTLYAPLAALGSPAIGAVRPGWTRPGRAAVLGLAAAALGILRSEEKAHAELEQDLHYAVRIDAAGRPLGDYHTTQVPGRRRNRAFDTRREELGPAGLNTILSTREYRTDCLFTAMLWKRAGAGKSTDLATIARAMRRPGFTPYLGRKAAPLGLPLDAQIIKAPSIRHALADYQRTDPAAAVLAAIGPADPVLIAADADAPHIPAGSIHEQRCDRLASRERWQFHDRDEAVFTASATYVPTPFP